MRLNSLVVLLFLSALFPSHCLAATPNLVFVLCDDLGYGDVRCLNPEGKIATPRIDKLAREGMLFTDAHSGSAVCSPTRYGIMTGRYAWRTKLQQHVLGGLSPRLIEPGRLTVAQFLKNHGYHTACFGKWHLGMDWVKHEGKNVSELSIETADQVWNVDYSKPITNGPNAVGFDEYFGISASLDMVPYTFLENDHVLVNPTAEKAFPLMLGRANRDTRKGPAAPDFEAEHVLPRVTQRAIGYLEERAKEKQPFFMYVPLASPHTPIAAISEWQGRSKLNAYADFAMQTDDCIGQIVDAIDRLGLGNDTLVIVTSDNGCSPEADVPQLASLGHRVSGPWRGVKADIYEGGHRVPFVARWTGRVEPGTRCNDTICLNDWMATCGELTGQAIPEDAAEDSFSFAMQLAGKKPAKPRAAVVHHAINGSFAIREGQWKLCLCPDSGGWSEPRPGSAAKDAPDVQLFDLDADPSETTNVATKHPEEVARLTKLLSTFVEQGRSTPGPKRENAVPIVLHKGRGK
jgi:arylsulfatase A